MKKIVGERYIPIFSENEWNKDIAYEHLTVVPYQGDSYISVTNVPIGVEITNKKYWVKQGNFNHQLSKCLAKIETMEQRQQTITLHQNDFLNAIDNSDELQNYLDTYPIIILDNVTLQINDVVRMRPFTTISGINSTLIGNGEFVVGDNCYVKDINFLGTSGDITFLNLFKTKNATIQNCTSKNFGYGIYLTECENLKIIGCLFEDNVTCDIYSNGSKNVVVEQCTVISPCSYHNIQFTNGFSNTVVRNIIKNSKQFGVSLFMEEKSQVESNNIKDTEIEAINIQDGNSCIISGNYCTWSDKVSKDFGISIYGAVDKFANMNLIANNYITNCGKSALAFAGNVINCIAENNIVYNCNRRESNMPYALVMYSDEESNKGSNNSMNNNRVYLSDSEFITHEIFSSIALSCFKDNIFNKDIRAEFSDGMVLSFEGNTPYNQDATFNIKCNVPIITDNFKIDKKGTNDIKYFNGNITITPSSEIGQFILEIKNCKIFNATIFNQSKGTQVRYSYDKYRGVIVYDQIDSGNIYEIHGYMQ